MERPVRRGFSDRLVRAMLEAGHVAKRHAAHGVDVEPLKVAAGVTKEMGRRYVTGQALPDPERMTKIAKWLKVSMPWLRDGIGDMRAPGSKANQDVTPYRVEVRRLSEIFLSLPSGLQNYMLLKAQELKTYSDALPAFIRDSLKPPKENYWTWERDLLSEMEKLQKTKEKSKH